MRILFYSLASLLLVTSCNNTKAKIKSDDDTTEDTKPTKHHKPVVDEDETTTDETDAAWTTTQKTKAAKVLEKALDPEDANDNYQHNSEEVVNKVFDCMVTKTEGIMTYEEFQAFIKAANSGDFKENAPASMKQKDKQLENFFEACGKQYHMEK